MMARLMLAVFAVIMLAGPAVEAVDDVAGWQNTTWGMTEDEVKTALGSDVVAITPPANYTTAYAPMKLPLKIAGRDLEAIPQFSKETKRLQQVILQAKTADLTVWAQLRDLLTEKYGAPQQIGEKREWRFKTTVIELTRINVGGIGATTIRYYPAVAYRDEKGKL